MDSPQKADPACPAEALLKQLSGKWKPQIFRLAVDGPLRFNALLRAIEGTNKAVAGVVAERTGRGRVPG